MSNSKNIKRLKMAYSYIPGVDKIINDNKEYEAIKLLLESLNAKNIILEKENDILKQLV